MRIFNPFEIWAISWEETWVYVDSNKIMNKNRISIAEQISNPSRSHPKEYNFAPLAKQSQKLTVGKSKLEKQEFRFHSIYKLATTGRIKVNMIPWSSWLTPLN